MQIVVDLGGTKTRVATFDTLDSPKFSLLDHFPTGSSYADYLSRLVNIIQAQPGVQGIGFAIGAQLTRDGQQIDVSYTMPDFVGKPIVRQVGELTGLPVKAANDNICGVLAETRFGSLSGFERAAYMTVSTGTGAGIRLGDGTNFIAFLAQVGHHTIDPHGERCTCGQVGCVQTITGGQQFIRRYGKPASEIDDETVWKRVCDALATAIVNLTRITRIDTVCVGGGIGYNSPYLRAHLASAVRAASPGLSIQVVRPLFGEDAPIVGAALLLRDDLDTTILH